MAAGTGQGVLWRLGKDTSRKQPSELPCEGGNKNQPASRALPLLLSFPSGRRALYKRNFLRGRGAATGRSGEGSGRAACKSEERKSLR